jgi:hemerythrin
MQSSVAVAMPVATVAMERRTEQKRPNRKLLDIYNALERIVDTSVADEHVPGTVISALFSFSRNELANEESQMETIGLPFEQKKEITCFKLTVFSYLAAMQFGHPPLASEVLDFLNSWIKTNLVDEQVNQILDRR